MSLQKKIQKMGIIIILAMIVANFAPILVIQDRNAVMPVKENTSLDYSTIFPIGNGYDPDIKINSNEELISYCGANASGSGSQSDPFLLFNLTIDTLNSIGITVENTDLYLRIYQCVFNYSISDNYLTQGQTGIQLVNCSHVVVEHNHFIQNEQSVMLDHCNQISILDNVCNIGAQGVRANLCDSCIISNNSMGVFGAGLFFQNSTNLLAESNELIANGVGVIVKQSVNITLQNNLCSANNNGGIEISGSKTSNIISNILSGNDIGFSVEDCASIEILSNTLEENYKNDLWEASNCEILNNTFIREVVYDIKLWNSTGNIIRKNNFTEFGKNAIRLYESNDNSITYNYFSEAEGIYAVKSSHNTVEHNVGVKSWRMLKLSKGFMIAGIIGGILDVALISLKALHAKSKIRLGDNSPLINKKLLIGGALASILVMIFAALAYNAA